MFETQIAAHKVNLGQDYSNQDIRVNFSARLPMPVLFGDLVLFQAGRIRLGRDRPHLDLCHEHLGSTAALKQALKNS